MSRAAKPPLGAMIDWGHPATRGLIHAWAFNERTGFAGRDAVKGAFLRNDDGDPNFSSARAFGGGVFFDGNDDLLLDRTTMDLQSATQMAGSAWVQPFACTIVAGIIQTSSISGFQVVVSPFYMEGGKVEVFPNGDSGEPTVLNTQNVVGYTMRPNGAARLFTYYQNGRAITTSNSAGGFWDTIFDVGGEGGSFLTGEISFLYIWGRELSESDMRLLSMDPYCIWHDLEADLLQWAAAAAGHEEASGPDGSSWYTHALG